MTHVQLELFRVKYLPLLAAEMISRQLDRKLQCESMWCINQEQCLSRLCPVKMDKMYKMILRYAHKNYFRLIITYIFDCRVG